MAAPDPSQTRRSSPLAPGTPSDVVAGLRRRRRRTSQRFLWTLLALVAGVVVVNTVAFGAEALRPLALAPDVALLAVVGLALALNARHRFHAAWATIVAALLLAAAAPLLGRGLDGGVLVLLLLFVPVVVAGLLLDRTALHVTAGLAAGLVLLTLALQGLGLLAVEPVPTDVLLTIALQFVAVLAIVVLFLDRFALSLHAALGEAAEREVALRDEIARRARADAALRDEMGFSDAIIDSLPGVFYVVDQDGTVIRSNRDLQRLDDAAGDPADPTAGDAPGDARGAPTLDRMLHVEDPAALRGPLDAAFERGSATFGADLVANGRARVPYVFHARRFDRGGSSFVLGVGIDRGELDAARERIERLNEELQERLARLTALHAIDEAITRTAETSRTLDVVLTQVTRRLEVDAASVLLYRPERRELTHGASRGFRTRAVHRTSLRLGEGQAGRAALARDTVLLEGRAALERAFADHSRLSSEGFRAYAAVPLVAKGKLMGVLELFHRDERPRSPDWHDFLRTLATQAAIALDNASMFEELGRGNEELRRAYDTTIEGWARALDLRDHETEGHSRRVTEMTERLAGRLGLNEDALVHVRRGALLHDIGKMGVPDAILRKPGALTDEEWALMKRHPTYGYELLRPIPFLRPAVTIPHCHHERWDGGGYPRGLARDEIPLPARTFAIVDVFDALTSDRPYRAAWSERQALAHVVESAGSHFDPDIVPVFAEMVREGAWVRT